MDTSVEMKQMLETAMKAHPESFANFDATKNVQDQLQEMVSELAGEPIFLLTRFTHWAEWCYLPDEASMEQLWLAFVMKEKYNKVWDGEEWIK